MRGTLFLLRYQGIQTPFTICRLSEPSESHSRNGATMTRSSQEDLEERIFTRLDPGGELGTMLAAFRPLTGNAFGRGLMRLLGGRDVDLDAAAAIDQQVQTLISGMARYIAVFTPLGWAPTKVAPVPVYEEALSIYDRSGSADMAEQVLVDGWNADGGLALRLRRLLNLGSDDEELTSVFRDRYSLVQKALGHHCNGAYEASVPIVLAQADGIVLELTGRQLFVAGKTKHLADSETLAGLPEGLRVLAPLLAESQRDTMTSGALRRHGILHGRELGYGTLINSTKCFVLLLAVMDWAEAPVQRLVEKRRTERETKYSGSTERDDQGCWLDRRGFGRAKKALEWVSLVQGGRLQHHGRCETDLAALPPEYGDWSRVEQAKLTMRASGDGQSYAAVRKVDGQNYWFGLGEKPGLGRWLFAGDFEPPADIAEVVWAGPMDDLPPDWAQADPE